MRGLYFQRSPFTQSKLVRCVKGAVLDVAVDIRKGSPTYGQLVAVELTEDNHRQFFVPRGFAHGFAVLSETAVFQYKCDNFYAPQADGGISIKDDSLGIDWKIPTENALLSEKDQEGQVPMISEKENACQLVPIKSNYVYAANYQNTKRQDKLIESWIIMAKKDITLHYISQWGMHQTQLLGS